MWTFKGAYSGEARAYIKNKEKNQMQIAAWIFSVVIILIYTISSFFLMDGIVESVIFVLASSAVTIAFALIPLFISYKREPENEIEIKNDGFYVYNRDRAYSFAFYKIQTTEEYDGFIVVKTVGNGETVLQKSLLLEGDWEALKIFLKKVEDSLETDDPVYQIEEPATEFLEATAKDKRIYENFVNGVSAVTPVGRFAYFVTFALENNEEIEFEVGREWFEKIEKGQSGTLLLINGGFYAFEDGQSADDPDSL